MHNFKNIIFLIQINEENYLLQTRAWMHEKNKSHPGLVPLYSILINFFMKLLLKPATFIRRSETISD